METQTLTIRRNSSVEANSPVEIIAPADELGAEPAVFEPLYIASWFQPTPKWKRWFDLVGASILLILAIPAMVVVACWIKCVSRGPVFFRQMRSGARGEPFRIWKFRTLYPANRDQDHREYIASLNGSSAPVAKPNHGSEMIPLGSVLRKFALDELPQLFNVLSGTMSLVGPRPDLLELEDYEPWQRRRFDVVPGMTGLWQVSGKNNLTFIQMVECDIAYAKRRSLPLDVMICCLTVPAVLGFDRYLATLAFRGNR